MNCQENEEGSRMEYLLFVFAQARSQFSYYSLKRSRLRCKAAFVLASLQTLIRRPPVRSEGVWPVFWTASHERVSMGVL